MLEKKHRDFARFLNNSEWPEEAYAAGGSINQNLLSEKSLERKNVRMYEGESWTCYGFEDPRKKLWGRGYEVIENLSFCNISDNPSFPDAPLPFSFSKFGTFL